MHRDNELLALLERSVRRSPNLLIFQDVNTEDLTKLYPEGRNEGEPDLGHLLNDLVHLNEEGCFSIFNVWCFDPPPVSPGSPTPTWKDWAVTISAKGVARCHQVRDLRQVLNSWFWAQWWSIPVLFVVVGIPLMVTWISMLKTVLGWFAIKTP